MITFAPTTCKGNLIYCGNSSVGRALASQAEGREFESRLPLNDPPPYAPNAIIEAMSENLKGANF